ncbi:MAG: hypothetical protein HY823_11450, partial [Acidobacteria bacterium]|nr:hypothetical protein [Acidobacteriota bacterium]
MRPFKALALAALLPLGAQEPSLFGLGPFRAEVPRPALGLRYTPHHELVAWYQALGAAAPDRVRVQIFHRTEEGLPQVLAVISSPANLARLDALKAGNARLSDPRTCSEAEAEALIARQPAFVWLGYSVHGAEPGGAEASMALAYRYAASQDPKVLEQLERVVLVLDPTQNPDGRERHIHAVAQALQGTNPPDPQDAQNTPAWPGGRFNHRLFDLNRDWSFQIQAESRAKAALFREWNPQVAVDHHEMGPEPSPFIPPPAEPANGLIPAPFAGPWQARIGQAIGALMDAEGQAWFSRETFDLFAPIYGDTWTSAQGIAGFTFECPNPGGLAMKRRDGDLLTLEWRIRRHLQASLGAISVAAVQRQALLADYHRARREAVNAGEKAGAFFLLEGPDPGRARALAGLLERNGIEVHRIPETLPSKGMEAVAGLLPERLPAGSYLVPLDQPRGSLARVLLARDVPFPSKKPSYDITAWSLPHLFGVGAAFAPLRPRVSAPPPLPPEVPLAPAPWGYLLPWGKEGQEKVLAALLAEGFRAQALQEPVELGGRGFSPGSVVLRNQGQDAARLLARLRELGAAHGAPALGLQSARAVKGPDLGSPKSLVLKAPRIALLMDSPANPTAVGAVIHTLREAGLSFTQLRAQRFAGAALRYTHLVIPDDGDAGRRWQRQLGEGGFQRLKNFLQEGGTVVALEGAAGALVRGGVAEAGHRHLGKAEVEAWHKEKDPQRAKPTAAPG